MSNPSIAIASSAQSAPAIPAPQAARSRTRSARRSHHPTLLRLAAPNVVVNVVLIAVTASIDAYFVGRLGHAPAGIALVFPLIMLMQQMANSSMGGAIASAVARAIGAAPTPTRRRWWFTVSSSRPEWPRSSPPCC